MSSLLERIAASIRSDVASRFEPISRGTRHDSRRIPGRYIPFVDVRTILTGVSSRISTTSLLPDEAAAWASAVRDRDDDFGSRSPTNIDWLNISLPPFAFRVPSHVQPCFTASVGEGSVSS
jgi:hypothetical protein